MNSLTRLGTGLGILLSVAGSLTCLRAPLAELAAMQTVLGLEAHREGVLPARVG